MHSTSPLFDLRIRESGRRKTIVNVYYNNVLLAENIPVNEGSITYDRQANIRASGSITIPDPSLVPSFVDDTLSPYGTEIQIMQGIVYPDGSEELIHLGMFILDTTSWGESDGQIPTIDVFDRSMIFNRQEITYLESYAGMTASDAIQYLINRNKPVPMQISVNFEWDGLTDVTLPGGNLYSTESHQSYWELLQQLALAMGGEIYFERHGEVIVAAPPVLDETVTWDDAVWDVTVGPNGILSDAQRAITRKETFNHIWVSGKANQNGNLPFYYALNDNPESPTYYLGPFGGQGKRFEMQELTTDGDCERVARLKLKEYMRLSKTVEFTSLPNPAMDAGDIVRLAYLDGSEELALVEHVTLPLGGGLSTGKCAASRL